MYKYSLVQFFLKLFYRTAIIILNMYRGEIRIIAKESCQRQDIRGRRRNRYFYLPFFCLGPTANEYKINYLKYRLAQSKNVGQFGPVV